MEGLHSLTCKAKELGLIKGASVGRDNMSISHLMYADDVIFGFKINVDKSNVLGVGVSDVETSLMARFIGCGVLKLPFKYLGVPVGCNMNRCVNWDVITQIFSSKLSSWKARLLSVGGRLSLIKAVLGNLPTYFMSIYLIIYGQSGGVFNVTNRRPKQSTWGTILSTVHRLKDKGIDLLSFCSKKLSNGESTRFWEDIWFGNTPLRLQFPRIYNLDNERNCLIANRIPLLLSDWSMALRRFPRGGAKMTQFDDLKAVIGSVSLTDQIDTWQWSLDVAGGFSVASARVFVDDTTLEADSMATRWNCIIPIKVNVFLWRLHLNKLPSKVNLDRRGVQIDFILCQTCQLDVETVNHIFFNCEMAKYLWSLLAKWWDLDILICANISEWYD
ncbi:RNA-directed DNA polymerase, eukaryota, reverse transcriptase zinc-binding domain protein [Tanacetum coccineum]